MNVDELDKLFIDLGIDKKEFYNIERLVDEYAEYIEKIGDKKITFGYSITDELIRGLRTQEVLTVIAQTGIGKLLTLDTDIPTPNGTKKMKDINIGDKVFSSNGLSCNVIAVSPIQTPKLYKITFDDKTTVKACADHQWEVYKMVNVWDKETKKSTQTRIKDILTTEQMVGSVRYGWDSRKRYAVKVSPAVEYPKKDLLIDPYTLGVWLGDGRKDDGRITCDDTDVETMDRVGIAYKVTKNKTKFAYGVSELKEKLQRLELINNKHIPKEYLYSSFEQRLALLQGLMDTDGTADKGGRVMFYNTDLNLIESVRELMASLGLKVTMQSKVGKIYGVCHKRCYMLYCRATIPVFKLQRKLKRQRFNFQKSINYRYIISIEEIQSEEGKCIRVDSPDSLYLCTKSFIPTHNSALALNLLQNYVKSSNELTVLFSLEMSSVGIAERIFQIELDVFGYEVEKMFKTKEQQFIQDCKNLQSSLNNLIIVVKRIDVHRIPDYIKIIEAIRNKKVSLVCIDYVGLMENRSFVTDEYGRLTDNMRRIYAYAKELNIAVINLSQVSRADLKAKESLSLFSGKGSGEIENSSDFVLALEKFKPEDSEYQNIQAELEERKISLLKLTILKNRRGQIASVIVAFNRKNLQIKEYSKMKQEEFEQQYLKN